MVHPQRERAKWAQLVTSVMPSVEMMRMVNSGTEATNIFVSARGVTGKDKIIKFTGCYHGHVDSLLIVSA